MEAQKQLDKIRAKLDPILNPIGFIFKNSGGGISSAGPFSAGFYIEGEKKIGLIYRSLLGLGSVTYECSKVVISHDNLIQHLKKQNESKLGYDPKKFSSYSKNGGDVIEALIYDIQNFSRKILVADKRQFCKELKRAQRQNN